MKETGIAEDGKVPDQWTMKATEADKVTEGDGRAIMKAILKHRKEVGKTGGTEEVVHRRMMTDMITEGAMVVVRMAIMKVIQKGHKEVGQIAGMKAVVHHRTIMIVTITEEVTGVDGMAIRKDIQGLQREAGKAVEVITETAEVIPMVVDGMVTMKVIQKHLKEVGKIVAENVAVEATMEGVVVIHAGITANA